MERFVGVLGNRSDGVSGQVEKVIKRRKGGPFIPRVSELQTSTPLRSLRDINAPVVKCSDPNRDSSLSFAIT